MGNRKEWTTDGKGKTIVDDAPIVKDIDMYNVPVFGPDMTTAVLKLFQDEQLLTVAKKKGVRLPSFTINTIVRSKMPKVSYLAQKIRKDMSKELDTDSDLKQAVSLLEKFVVMIQDL